MAPFSAAVVVESLKEKVDALLAQGNRLFVASAAGTLRVYRIEDSSGGGSATTTTSAVLVETKKAFTRRAIDQLGFIRDINALVILSDSTISLYDATSLALLTTLFQTRGAQTFAIHTSIPAPSALLDDDDAPSPSMRTHLVVGIKKRLLLFSWADGALMPSPDPLVLPHTPRSIAFVSSDRVVVAYSSNEQVLAGLGPLRLIGSDLLQGREPPEKPQSVVSGGLGGLTAGLGGMGGYMGLGSLSKSKANVIRVGEDEVLVARDNVGISFNSKGDLKRSEDLEWAAAPDEMVCARPFMLSVLPSIAATSNAPSSSATPTPTIQIRSAHTLHLLQTFALPSSVPPHTIHHLIPSSSSTSSQSTLRPPLYFVSTPTERAALASEGSKIWCLSAQSLGETLDELVKRGEYEEGLAFMESVDERTLPDKESRETLLRTLRSLQLFQSPSRSAKDEAIDSFITLSLNPTKVIALFPPIVSGRLSTPEAEWTELFGGPKVTERKELATSATAATEEEEGGTGRKVLEVLGIVGKESHEAGEAESIKSDEETEKERAANLKQSFESLLHYLSDRRQKVLGALGPVDLSPLEALPPISTVPKDELLAIPSKPMQDLSLEQVYRLAQVVDTALFKSYLVVRPSLVGSLCRLENFCEVAEVEEQLLEKKKYGDLIDLYRTRKEHAKALKLLKELSKDEDDLEDKLEPIVRYLLGMGPKYLDLIFETSPWVFSQSFDAGMQIFTADPDTVEPFPRSRVLAHLETISQRATTAYLEFLIDKLGEEGADFHDRLAELYLGTSTTTSKKGSRATAKAPSPESYAQALNFLKTSQHYRPDHLLRVLPDDDMYEARAVLLGRLGNHEAALHIYVHRLEDYDKAEEYCLRVSQSNPPVNIFLPLLRIYLVPKPPHTKLLIPPALSLIAKHSTSLEPLEVIDLLPPLLTMQEVHSFFLKTLREGKARRNEARVLREVMKSQGQATDRTLMRLQERRVRITDTRLCPWCKKRLGDSVIAVHAPRGEITHLHCKDAFSASLKR